jgi:hypothetical protein
VAERPIAAPAETKQEIYANQALLNDKEFDPETVRVLGCAFEQCCVALPVGTFADDMKQTIANKIVELAKTGERSSDRLCERALEEIRQPHM